MVYIVSTDTSLTNHYIEQLKQKYIDIETILDPRNEHIYNLTPKVYDSFLDDMIGEKGRIILIEGSPGTHKSTSAIYFLLCLIKMIIDYTDDIKKRESLKLHIKDRVIEIKKEWEKGNIFNWNNIQYTNYEMKKRLEEANKSVEFFIKDERTRDFGQDSRVTLWELMDLLEQKARKRVWFMVFCSQQEDLKIPHHLRLLSLGAVTVYDKPNGTKLFEGTRFLVIKTLNRRQMPVGYMIIKRLPLQIENDYDKYCKNKRVGDDKGEKGTIGQNEKLQMYIDLTKRLWDKPTIRKYLEMVENKEMKKFELEDQIMLYAGRKLSNNLKKTLRIYLMSCHRLGGFEKWVKNIISENQ